jgi:hypothetical protein
MAQKTVVELIDDLDGSPADETVTFALDGKELQLDLSADHASKLREIMAPYIAAGRRAGSSSRHQGTARRPEGPARPSSSRDHAQRMRDWLRQQGEKIADRGRIPTHLVEKYEQRFTSFISPSKD